MDKVIGISCGNPLQGDGGAALVIDGEPIIAISEERLSRQKYDGAFLRSLTYCLEGSGLKIADIDAFVFGSCGDLPLKYQEIKDLLASKGIEIPREKILINHSHDLAHAASSFFCSPFDRALIAVVDFEEEIFKGTSLYLGKGNEISPLSCDSLPGVGAVYEYVTKLLGYSSYQEAGKTMALAAYGTGELNGLDLFAKVSQKSDKHWFSLVKEHMEKRLKRQLKQGSTRQPSAEQIELAWLIQKETEKSLLQLVKSGIKCSGESNLCMAGGVGLNCVANYFLAKGNAAKSMFIQPASGDSGHCLGNAFYGYYLARKNRRLLSYAMENAYLGVEYPPEIINQALMKYSQYLKFVPNDGVEEKVSMLLQEGFIVGWFQGKSEFGPRALGNRSILANPYETKVKKRLDKIKSREYYRPYAPSVLAERAAEFFEISGESPFMLMAVKAKKEKIFLIPSVVHVDGSSRIQTVTKEQNPRYYKLIKDFYLNTDVPMLLNTSFNRAGEPIVETPEDAIKCFLATDIDYLALGDVIVSKA
ncbi:MAG: hypothetical protein IKD08_04265 [Alphaproteobacteria bacterium]|nr:hypothetical protein [Alphaproteobacteria bacterium]